MVHVVVGGGGEGVSISRLISFKKLSLTKDKLSRSDCLEQVSPILGLKLVPVHGLGSSTSQLERILGGLNLGLV